MILIGLIAFLAGMFAGYVSLRALGWLVVVGLCVVGFEARATITFRCVNNHTNYAAAFWDFTSAGDLSFNAVAGSGGTAQNTGSDGSYNGQSAVVYWQIPANSSPGPGNYCWSETIGPVASGGTYTSTFPGFGGAPSYVASGCLTNGTQNFVRFIWRPSVGDPQVSGLIPPGGPWCIIPVTNAAPFTHSYEAIIYNNDLGTNTVLTGGPWQAATNSPVAVATTYAGTNPGNPFSPGSPGGTSTNPVSGLEFVTGMSNVANLFYQMQQAQLGGLAMLGQSNNSAQSSALLAAISNNTMLANLNATQYQAYFRSNFDWLGSNQLSAFMSQLLNPGEYSNSVRSAAQGISNAMYAAGTEQAEQILNLTNVDRSGDESIWTLPIYTNVAHSGFMNLNPKHTLLFEHMSTWVRMVFEWILCAGAMWFIKGRVYEELRTLLQVPGSGPGKSPLAALSAFTLTAMFGFILAAFPVFLAGALDSVVTLHGGIAASPFSVSGTAAAGSFGGAIKEGIVLFESFFPFGFLLALGAYLLVFDICCFSVLVYAAMLVRRLMP